MLLCSVYAYASVSRLCPAMHSDPVCPLLFSGKNMNATLWLNFSSLLSITQQLWPSLFSFLAFPFSYAVFLSQSSFPTAPGVKILSASRDVKSLLFSQQLKGLVSPSQGLQLLDLLTPLSPHCLQAFFFCPDLFPLGVFILNSALSLLLSPRISLFRWGFSLFPSSLPLGDTR